MHGAQSPLSQMPSWYAKVQHGSLLSMLLVWQHLDSHTCVRTFTNSSKYIGIVYGLYTQNVFCVLRNTLSRTMLRIIFENMNLRTCTNSVAPGPLLSTCHEMSNDYMCRNKWGIEVISSWSCVYIHIYRHNTVI